MTAFGTVCLFVALGLMVPALFLAICREALRCFSRKALLESVPAQRRDALEDTLSLKDEYESHLETLVFLLVLIIVVSFSVGRLLTAFPEGGTLYVPYVAIAWMALEMFLATFVGLYLIPSVVARVWAESWVLRFLTWIVFSYRLAAPWRSFWGRLLAVGSLPFGGKERTSADIVEEEILSAVEEGEREGLLKSRDIDMIESIMTYGDVEVSEVMTPRTEMVTLDLSDSIDQNLERVIECGHSRIPVVQKSKDNIVGVLYVKDLQKYWVRKEEIDLVKIVRDPYLVSHHKKIGELLQEFKGHRQHLAIVQDDEGGTAGLITIEDILEEIVGEISDEYESAEPPIQRLESGVVEVNASVHIHELNDELALSIPEGETYDTVGGYLFENLGKVPAVGDTFEWETIRFEVTEADDRRVRRLRLRLPADPGSASAGAAIRDSGRDGKPGHET